MTGPSPSVVWFRDDLRLTDNPALRAAVDRDESIVGLYVLDEESEGVRPLGGAAKWWMHHSLVALAASLEERGSTLVLGRGRAADVVPRLVTDAGAGAVFWNRRYGGAEREIDAGLKTSLRADGLQVESFAASVLFEPWTVMTGDGRPFSVYTPFWKACRNLPAPRAPLPEPRELRGPSRRLDGDDLDAWGLLPTTPDWAGGLRERWEPGEAGAKRRLREFLRDDLDHYDSRRNMMGEGATSDLSPRLRWGEVSPYTVWHDAIDEPKAGGFLSEIGWREFAWHTLYHFPDLATRNWRRSFDAFPWPPLDPSHLEAWQHGETGVPLVDAGMRELWLTGYMHNRVRMVTASFLTKNLLIDWRLGEQWFWDTLCDADEASNPFNWQWVAGSGADAAPYFRVFNPVLQQEKFDPHLRYVRQWAPDSVGDDARAPIVDLKETRNAALEAYQRVRNAR